MFRSRRSTGFSVVPSLLSNSLEHKPQRPEPVPTSAPNCEHGAEVPGVSFTGLVELITALEPEMGQLTPFGRLVALELARELTERKIT